VEILNSTWVKSAPHENIWLAGTVVSALPETDQLSIATKVTTPSFAEIEKLEHLTAFLLFCTAKLK
jgi:hypothetical protein